MKDVEVAWDAVHDPTPAGWHVGRPESLLSLGPDLIKRRSQMRELDGMRIIGPADGQFELTSRSKSRELVSATDTDGAWRLGEVIATAEPGGRDRRVDLLCRCPRTRRFRTLDGAASAAQA